MPDHAELIERLRSASGRVTTVWPDLVDEAATALDALVAENARIREALKPFAEAADDYRYGDPGHHGVVFISDLRRARAALAQGGGE